MALDDLEIIIDIVDSFSDEIDKLLADLESVDIQSSRVDDIYLDATNLADDEIAELQTQLASLTDKNLIIDTDIRGEEKLLSYAALKEAAAADEISQINFEERGLDEIIAKLSVANAQAMGLRSAAGGMNFGGGGEMPGWGGPARGDVDDNPLALSMSSLHNALATLIPMLLVYVGALPAAIGGVVALGAAAVSAAAALAALGGLSFYGLTLIEGDGDAMAGLSDIAEEIQSDFADAFAPLARDLAPLAEDAVAGLGEMFSVLASHGDILTGLTDEARDFGQFMQEYIVGTAVAMGQFAEAAAPMLGIFAGIIERADLLEASAGFLAETLPELLAFGSALADIVVNIMQLSVGFLSTTTYITQFIDALLFVISGFGLFEQQVGAVIGALLALITVTSMLYKLVTSQFIVAVHGAIMSLYEMGLASAFAAAKQQILAAANTVASLSFLQLAAAVAVATAGLAILLGIGALLSSQFLNTSSAIDEATESLREFEDVQSDLDGMGAGSSNVYAFNPTTQQTQINASNVQDASRVAKREKFRSDDFSISQ